MGVKGPFWVQLKSCARSVSAESIEGKRLAIDMSAWLVEAESSKGLGVAHAHPHLFLVFSRVVKLLKLKCRPIGVFEGKAHPQKKRKGRKLLDEKGEAARQLLEALGVPCVHAPEEAEATAAALTAKGLADGVISEDSDALLYGATAVYRGLGGSRESVVIDASQHEVFGLGGSIQHSLVACALLVGTDIIHNSPPGIGVDKAFTFLKHCAFRGQSALDVIVEWRDDRPDVKKLKNTFLTGASSETAKISTAIWRHCKQGTFPDDKIVATFLDHDAKIPPEAKKLEWRQPSAKALYFVNALHCVYGHTLETSGKKIEDILASSRVLVNDDDENSEAGGSPLPPPSGPAQPLVRVYRGEAHEEPFYIVPPSLLAAEATTPTSSAFLCAS
ncbi:hypothetical protein CTAYLR_000336 [Chrysophaeum taylorii]|uniref:XPG-I domain-containing protein n=1 Tax=Chrysophaeum taylorii TaxID=2483200 RepID=A0AAD7UE82_9STRA|nr:hypothetical protein CTAYLR_000336 [Chrysophaeum taylorii]